VVSPDYFAARRSCRLRLSVSAFRRFPILSESLGVHVIKNDHRPARCPVAPLSHLDIHRALPCQRRRVYRKVSGVLPTPFCPSCLTSYSHFPPAWFAVNMGRPDFQCIWAHLFAICSLSYVSYRYRCSFDNICVVSVRVASQNL
jgi:hypothetical protein